MRVLLTGGAGYIGTHTAVALLEKGHSVVILDDLSNSSEVAVRRVREVTGSPVTFVLNDLRNADSLSALLTAESIEAVIHFAGFKAVGASVNNPIAYYENNVSTTIVLLQAMQSADVRKFVFSSSATVYENPSQLPVDEDSPVGLDVSNPYGRTKVMIEQILQDLTIASDSFAVAALRYFNPVGAHPSGTLGEDPRGTPSNLLPFVSQVAAGLRDEVLVYGNDYETADGTGVRDYVHVMDLADGHVTALETLDPGFAAYNLGTGQGTSVLELIEAFSAVSGKEIPYRIVERRPGDVAVSFASVGKAHTVLGWSASRTVVDACRDAWNWQSSNPRGYSS